MLVVIALFFFASLALARPQDGQYTTKYDSIDLDEILNNDRLYKKYYECLIGEGKCTPDGKELKDVIPDALTTNCSKCSEKHKNGVEKVLKFLIEKKKADFDKLANIYDSDGTYLKKYKEEAEKRGIKID